MYEFTQLDGKSPKSPPNIKLGKDKTAELEELIRIG
jgi:hypothetical protein